MAFMIVAGVGMTFVIMALMVVAGVLVAFVGVIFVRGLWQAQPLRARGCLR